MIYPVDDFLKKARLPYFTTSLVRELKRDECCVLFDIQFTDKKFTDHVNEAGATIFKEKGFYVMEGLWINLSGKTVFVPSVKFKLLKNRMMEISDTDLPSLIAVAKMCRRAHRWNCLTPKIS